MDIVSSGPGVVTDPGGDYGLIRASLQRVVDDDEQSEGRVEDYGEMPVSCALGVMASPAPSTESGGPEWIFDTDVGGFPAAAVAGWDARCREVAGQLSPGDTCLHGTHLDTTKRAKFHCKENLASITVGNDVSITVDRGKKDISITAFGLKLEMSDTNGILLCGDGGAYIQIKGGSISIVGNVAFGNTNPATAGSVAVIGSSGTPVPSTSVFTNG